MARGSANVKTGQQKVPFKKQGKALPNPVGKFPTNPGVASGAK